VTSRRCDWHKGYHEGAGGDVAWGCGICGKGGGWPIEWEDDIAAKGDAPLPGPLLDGWS
jgi:hypothetical protein